MFVPLVCAAMTFRWDWLRPLLTVPYVPTLGPMHPNTLSPRLFADIVDVAGTGRILPYDKDRWWAKGKEEHVLADDIVHAPGLTLIPTLSGRGQGTVKVHVYCQRPDARDDAAELAAKLCAVLGAASGRVLWFQPPGDDPDPVATCARMQLRTFTADQPTSDPSKDLVRPLDEHPDIVRRTFAAFAEKMSGEGFAFLHDQMCTGDAGPVLVTVRDARVVGAIGPMQTMLDPVGAHRMLPQYFAVLPEYRGEGLGRAVWRAAMHWGQSRGADYQLLQTAVGGASDHLCRVEGLTDLGFVCSSFV